MRERVAVKKHCSVPKMTKQSFKQECDINYIVNHWMKHGELLHTGSRVPPRYGDFSNATDYQTAVNQVSEAKRQFDLLPAKIRERFDNQPWKLLDFLADPANHDEGVDLGLFEPVPAGPEIPATPEGSGADPETEPTGPPPTGG